jgi:cytochrome c1
VELLRYPRRARPGTPMPEMNLTDTDARDVAAYLYALK